MSILTSIIDVPPQYCGILGSAILVGIVLIGYIEVVILPLEENNLVSYFFSLPKLLDARVEYIPAL